MSYANRLHPTVPSSKTSNYSSLGGALVGASPSEFIVPHRRRLPQGVFAPSSKWHQTISSPNNAPIAFDYLGYTGQGVPMCEFHRPADELAQIIRGSNDLVLKPSGARKIVFRILWPGYGHIDWIRSVEVASGGNYITRAQLGAQACANISRFLEKARYESSTMHDYQIATNGIQVEHLILVQLFNVMDDIWQADIAIDLR